MPVVGAGLILGNSHYKALFTGSVYSGPLKSVCVPFLNCHACPFAVGSCPVGMIQHFAAIRQFPFFILGFLGIIGVDGDARAIFANPAAGRMLGFSECELIGRPIHDIISVKRRDAVLEPYLALHG